MTTKGLYQFLDYRRRTLLGLLTIIILVSFGGKYINVLLAIRLGSSRISDVPGMKLTQFATFIPWDVAKHVGAIAALSAVLAVLFARFVTKLRVRTWGRVVVDTNAQLRETIVYAAIFTIAAAIARTGELAAQTLAYQNLAPILVYALLNPTWSGRKLPYRLALALVLSLLGFVLSGSKLLIFHLFLAVGINLIYRRRQIWPIFVSSLSFAIVYPYLNTFRGIAASTSAGEAFGVVVDRFVSDLFEGGVTQMLVITYGNILDRITGLDGVLLSNSLDFLYGTSSKAISYQLADVEGVGISLSLMGQLNLTMGSLFGALLAYPILVGLIWRATMVLDTQFARWGFTSVGTFFYVKAVQVLIGGFRYSDSKVTLATVFLIAVPVTILSLTYSSRRRESAPGTEPEITESIARVTGER